MFVAVVAVTIVASSGVPAAESAVPAPDYQKIIEDEAYWVSTAQLHCTGDGHGAIAEARIAGPAPVSIHPYEANLGARAMLAAGPRYFPMVRSYLDWYRGHLNRPDASGVRGTVYDYDVDPTTCTSTFQPHPVTGAVPKYDSTDAYAGTFLSLVAEYARVNPGDRSHLRAPGVRRDLDLVADVVEATTGPNGLSAATPSYPAQYLLDNVEASLGLRDYSWLLSHVLGDAAGAARYGAQADRMDDAIETHLWEASRVPGMYGWAADELTPSWGTWYPDSVAQVWPIWGRVGPAQRRSAAWTEFTARWPQWWRSTPLFGSVSVEHDPNPAVAYAAARIGDREALDAYLHSSQVHWIDTGRPPPWTVDDSGFRALAAQAGISL